jgi:hypothetical protein
VTAKTLLDGWKLADQGEEALLTISTRLNHNLLLVRVKMKYENILIAATVTKNNFVVVPIEHLLHLIAVVVEGY